jgi:hypothetical protein
MHNITDTLSDSFANFKMLHPGSFHYALEGTGTVLVATGYQSDQARPALAPKQPRGSKKTEGLLEVSKFVRLSEGRVARPRTV